MGDIGLASLVGEGVLAAPLGGDPAEVAAGILALSVVAHLEGGKLRYVVSERVDSIDKSLDSYVLPVIDHVSSRVPWQLQGMLSSRGRVSVS